MKTLEKILMQGLICTLIVDRAKAISKCLSEFTPPLNIVAAAVISKHYECLIEQNQLEFERQQAEIKLALKKS